MKGKKATFEQRKILKQYNLDTYKWLVQKDASDFMQVVNKETREERRLEKV